MPDKKIILFSFSFILLGIVVGYLFQSKKNGPSKIANLFKNPWIEFSGIVLLSSLLFLSIPHFFFDDSGFILRHLDHFKEGYLFKFNTEDPSVYGISGFVHGVFTGLLCWLHIASPEQALYISNYLGFVLSAFVIFRIFKRLIPQYGLVVLLWVLVITSSKMYLNVASCGLETPLHLAIVLSGVYFLLSDRLKLFLLFTAFMILSKLDAVPVAGVLLLFYLLKISNSLKGIGVVQKHLALIIVYFILSLSAGLIFITLIFGSPLPQSAFAKIYYHTHSTEHWFPFLEYFINSSLRLILLGLFLILGSMHLAETIIRKSLSHLKQFLWGMLFLGIMALYYFYNPGEKMMWYYAMPELFLMIQVFYSIQYFIRNHIRFKWVNALVLAIWALFAGFIWTDVYNSFNWLKSSVQVIENERTKIGMYLGEMSKPNEILVSGHGLLSRPFKGYVLDISGLNSKVATDYRLRADSIISSFQPDYIINHATPGYLNIYNQFNYEIIGLYRDITIQGYSSWILLKKIGTKGPKHSVGIWDESFTRSSQVKTSQVYSIIGNGNSIAIYDNYVAQEKYLHIGVERMEQNWDLQHITYKNGQQIAIQNINIPAFGINPDSPSQQIFDLKIDISNVDSIVFNSSQPNLRLIEPLFELISPQ